LVGFITIATYDEYVTAYFAKRKLRAKGIYCYLGDENTVTMKWILKNALGGIRLRVLGRDEDIARQILEEQIEPTAIEHTLDKGNNDVICPNCGSNNTATEKYSKSIVGWSWLIIGVPFAINPGREHRCFYCEHKWEENPERASDTKKILVTGFVFLMVVVRWLSQGDAFSESAVEEKLIFYGVVVIILSAVFFPFRKAKK
jgi:hypothetical protein